MKVLVLGATGLVGSAVVESLISGGHEVVALIRNDRQLPVGVEPRIGDLSVPASLEGSITDNIDVVVHAASPGDDWDVEKASLANLLKQLDGGDRAFVYISGVWVLGATPVDDDFGVDEHSPLNPITLVSGRGELERMVLDHEGVRGVVIRPGIVHGRGSGIPAMMVNWAAEHNTGRYVGAKSDIMWPMVHVDDLAALIVLTVESADARGIFHGVSEPGLAVRDIASAADMASGRDGRTEQWAQSDAAAVLGEPFAEALSLHQIVRAPRAIELGWKPANASTIEDIRSGSYCVTSKSLTSQAKAT